ncbi:hypothetical protein [Kitasatospora sp. LaBMicrA B282]|uniref:hypothetical protein n=1 Tax=Kitasatospora sp. LaBMicrA B282 TaxID=3420949 RepID=UPI003D0F7507
MVLPLLGLLVALLVALPCAGSALAATPLPHPSAGGPSVDGPAGAPPSTQAGTPAEAHHGRTPQQTRADQRTRAGQRTRTDRHHAHPAPPRAAAELPAPVTLCAVDAPGQRPGDGCSSHPCPGQEAQLPNAPPQPGPADLPLLTAVRPAATPGFAATAPQPAPTPDLHLLQVNRT